MSNEAGRAGEPVPKSAARSRIMRSIRAKGNKSTELRMMKTLRKGYITGWRRHANLVGTPDFVWHRARVALFVDGCFWHGCPKCYLPPRHNASFWSAKVSGNRKRDRRVNRLLRSAGWRVVRIWECQIDDRMTLDKVRQALSLQARKNRGDSS